MSAVLPYIPAIMTLLSGAMDFGAKKSAGNAMVLAAQRKKQGADFQAAQYDINAGQQEAASQFAAQDSERKGRYEQSRRYIRAQRPPDRCGRRRTQPDTWAMPRYRTRSRRRARLTWRQGRACSKPGLGCCRCYQKAAEVCSRSTTSAVVLTLAARE